MSIQNLQSDFSRLTIKHKNAFYKKQTHRKLVPTELVNIMYGKQIIAADVDLLHADEIVSCFNTQKELESHPNWHLSDE